ncbi:MAG: hypothetical protein MOP49_1017 [Nitrososphaera sp.]|nr:hypothetical protein [Nitrososphaera sp.]
MTASTLLRSRYNLPFDDLLSLSLCPYHGKKKNKSKSKSKSNDDNDNRFTKALVGQNNSCSNYTHNNNNHKKTNNHKKLRRLNKLAALEATYP